MQVLFARPFAGDVARMKTLALVATVGSVQDLHLHSYGVKLVAFA